MIEIMFNRANEVAIARIQGNKVEFGNTLSGAKLGTIEGLRLDYAGTIKEFPDLKNDIDWRSKAIERFEKLIKSMKTEKEIMQYLIADLKNHGYIARRYQVAGSRPQLIKWDG